MPRPTALQMQENDIKDGIDDLRKDLDNLSSTKYKGNQREQVQLVRTCNQGIQKINNLIDMLQAELRNAPNEIRMGHEANLQDFRHELRKLQTDFDWKKTEIQQKRQQDGKVSSANAKNQLLQGANMLDSDNRRLDQVKIALGPGGNDGSGGLGMGDHNDDAMMEQTQQQRVQGAIAIGDRLQDNTDASLKRILRMAADAETIGAKALNEMHAQEERMNHMHQDMDDIQGNLQRSKKIIAQIARGAASDRCVQILCCVIVVAIILCVILAMTGKDQGRTNMPDEVRNNRLMSRSTESRTLSGISYGIRGFMSKLAQLDRDDKQLDGAGDSEG